MSYLLQLTIFGNKGSNLKCNEMIYKSTKTMLVHIASKQRMDSLLKKEDCCATEYPTKNKGIITASGKVNIIRNEKNILGYILEESNSKWKIILKNNKMIWIDIPKYCQVNHQYIL